MPDPSRAGRYAINHGWVGEYNPLPRTHNCWGVQPKEVELVHVNAFIWGPGRGSYLGVGTGHWDGYKLLVVHTLGLVKMSSKENLTLALIVPNTRRFYNTGVPHLWYTFISGILHDDCCLKNSISSNLYVLAPVYMGVFITEMPAFSMLHML